MSSETVPEENKTTYGYLGRSGLKVSNICLGTMTFGEGKIGWPTQSSEDQAHKILDRFAEWGGNFIDTADMYSGGLSEQIIGNWLKKQKRDEFVLATKCRFSVDPKDKLRSGLSRRHIVAGIDESLKRLQTDYVDLYQMHCWDAATPIQETLRTFDDLIRCGKIRYAGASNLKGWQLQKILDLQDRLNLNPFISLQQQYNLLNRESEYDVFEVCENDGIGVMAWSPLKGGLLTGKYKRDHKPPAESGRLGWAAQDEKRQWPSFPGWEAWKKDNQIWSVLDFIEKLAVKYKKSVPQISLKWVLQRKVVASTIVGATKLEQLDSNMAVSTGWELSDEDMKELNDISSPKMPYPYNFSNKINGDRINPFSPQPTIAHQDNMTW